MRMRTCVLVVVCVEFLLRARYAIVQAIVGVGTVIIPYIGVAYTRGGGGFATMTERWLLMCSRGWCRKGISRPPPLLLSSHIPVITR